MSVIRVLEFYSLRTEVNGTRSSHQCQTTIKAEHDPTERELM